MTALARKTSAPRISQEEMERRRKIVEEVHHSNLMEGIKRNPKTDPVYEAYIQGEIEAKEILPRIRQLRTRQNG